jgi:hypothetical protein
MKRTLVQYRTKPEAVGENERLIQAVFAELRTRAPKGIQYLALRLDGRFMHLVSVKDGTDSVTALESFRAFQGGIRERCLEAPQAAEVTVVGNYRMLDECPNPAGD